MSVVWFLRKIPERPSQEELLFWQYSADTRKILTVSEQHSSEVLLGIAPGGRKYCISLVST